VSEGQHSILGRHSGLLPHRLCYVAFAAAFLQSDRCYVWEDSFKSKVSKIRGEEMKLIGKAQYTMAVSTMISQVRPFFHVTAICFIVN